MVRFPPHGARHLNMVPLPVVTGIGYYLAAIASLHLTRGDAEIATLWPPSGILFAILFAASPRRAPWHLAAATLASLAANLGAGNPVATSFGFTLANMTETAVAVWLLRTRTRCRLSFTSSDGLACFCKTAVIGSTLSASIATAVAAAPTPRFWLSWFATDLLGILIVTPVLLIVGTAVHRGRLVQTQRRLREMALVFLMVAIVAAITFAQSRYPLLFVPMLAVLLAVLRLGTIGAAGGVLIVAMVSAIAMTIGSGPLALVHAATLTRSLFLQAYLVALFVATLPIAALLAGRERLLARLAEQMRLLQLAESAAQVGHWRLDTATQAITWSQEVFRIHGMAGPTPPALDRAIEAYHPDDRAAVAAHIEHALGACCGFEFVARIVRPDGEVRHVLSKGEIDRIRDDGSFGLFGIIRDITTQVAQDAAMQEARRQAERAARDATILAETDQLTGIANRRRTAVALDQAVLAAQASGQPLSVAMFDIDHFKRINDTFGHQAGDRILVRVAADAAAELRGDDVFGRFGGEDFVIVLPQTIAQTALMIAERVRGAIERGGTDQRVTISIGVAELAGDESAETLLRRADQALYSAKHEGRNTLRLAA